MSPCGLNTPPGRGLQFMKVNLIITVPDTDYCFSVIRKIHCQWLGHDNECLAMPGGDLPQNIEGGLALRKTPDCLALKPATEEVNDE